MFLRLMEFLIYVILLLSIGSQIVIPLWRNRPMFPLFRQKRKVESKFGEAVEQKEVNELLDRMRTLRNRKS